MKKSFLFKVLPPLIIFVVFLFPLPIELEDIENFNDVVGYSIGIGGSSLGFLVAAVTLLQSGSISRFMQRTIELGTDKKIVRWIMTSILYSFIFSFAGLFMLLFHNLYLLLDRLLFSLWISSLSGVLISGAMTVLSLFIIFIFEDRHQ